LTSMATLSSGDSVVALIVLEDGGYLMQLRDQKPDIFYPGHWGLFGGAVDSGEDLLEAISRELEEELDLKVSSPVYFANFVFDLSPAGIGSFSRRFYEVPLAYAEYKQLKLREGADMKVFTGREIMLLNRVVPCDTLAIWHHYKRHRLK